MTKKRKASKPAVVKIPGKQADVIPTDVIDKALGTEKHPDALLIEEYLHNKRLGKLSGA
jgi:hypothetical protein